LLALFRSVFVLKGEFQAAFHRPDSLPYRITLVQFWFLPLPPPHPIRTSGVSPLRLRRMLFKPPSACALMISKTILLDQKLHPQLSPRWAGIKFGMYFDVFALFVFPPSSLRRAPSDDKSMGLCFSPPIPLPSGPRRVMGAILSFSR